MFRTIIAAAAVAFTATAVCAGDAGEDVIRLGPPLDNDVFAAASAWQASAPSETGRHGNAARIASEMAAKDAERETALVAAR